MLRGVTIHRAPVLFRTRLDVASQISMYSFLPSGIWTGLRKIDPDSIDLINTHFAIPSGPTGVYLARKWNKPHVLTTHGGDLYDPSKKLSPHRIPPPEISGEAGAQPLGQSCYRFQGSGTKDKRHLWLWKTS